MLGYELHHPTGRLLPPISAKTEPLPPGRQGSRQGKGWYFFSLNRSTPLLSRGVFVNNHA